MKAVILNEYGEDAEFQAAEMPQPVAKLGHVVVRVLGLRQQQNTRCTVKRS